MTKVVLLPNGLKPDGVAAHKWMVGVLLFVLSFILYGNTLKNGYAMDDELVILNNERTALGWEGIPRVWSEPYVVDKKASYEYRPITLTTFQMEYALFGANPKVGHWISILLYGLTGVLLYLLLFRLFQHQHWILPLIVVVLFMVHPLHTEVVASIKSRDELLALLFGIASMRNFLRYADTNKWHWLLLGGLFFALSILSKTSTLTFLALIPLTLYFFTEVNWKKVVLPFASIAVFFIAARRIFWTPIREATNRDALFFENPLFEYDRGIAESLPMGAYTVGYYLKLLFVPYPLTFYYGYDEVKIVGWESGLAIFLGIILIGLLGLAIWGMLKRNKPIWSYGILFFLIGISMYANVVKPAVGIIGERFAYIPSIGFCIVIGWLLYRFILGKQYNAKFRQRAPWLIAAVGTIALIHIGMTISRNPVWKDHMTLYTHDIKHADRSAKAHALIAGTLYPKARQTKNLSERNYILQTSEYHFQQSIAIFDGYYTMQNNLGTLYFGQGQYAKAKPYFAKAVHYKPDYVEGNYNLAFSYEKLGKVDSAIVHYKKTLELDSTYRRAWPKLAIALVRQNRWEEALTICRQGAQLYPAEPDFHIQAGTILTTLGDTAAAIQSFERGFEIMPKSGVANHIASLYQQTGNRQKAGEYAQKGIELSQRGQ